MVDFKIENLSFSYPNSELKILKNINIEINRGEFVVLCGKSGCGKTTLLRQLKTVLSPKGKREGKIYFRGTPIEEIDYRIQISEIGYVFQNPENQIVSDNVLHEMAFGLENMGVESEKIRIKIAEMVTFFGIQDWANKSVTTLSGGQKQILNLAAIMAMNPSVLILDEPTSQLDPVISVNFLDILKRINSEFGTTIIISEHKLNELLPLSDKIIILEEGEVLFQDSPREIGRNLNKIKNSIILNMPTVVKVYSEVNNELEMPLTINEGIDWLNKLFKNKRIIHDGIEDDYTICSINRRELPNAIEFSHVYFKYDNKGNDIIKDLTFNVKLGEIYCILGGNGTGKTTTIDIISHINKPYRGKVKLLSKILKKYFKSPEKSIAVLPQNIQTMFSKETVEQEIYESLSSTNILGKEKRDMVEHIISDFKLDELRTRHPYDLSAGEQQRLALAKVFILDTKIIILDEPTKGMDNDFKLSFIKIMRNKTQSDSTILMVSHDIEFCAKYADMCALFFDGTVVVEANPREFFMNNNFYTTCANRMSKHIFKNAITDDEVISLCNKNGC